MENWIENGNLFMMCEELNPSALTEVPEGYHIRPIRREELDVWKEIHFDRPEDAAAARPFMDSFFQNVYGPDEPEFWKRCVFLCDGADRPVGTCFAWRAYGRITTIHWFKVIRPCENRGLGRALLSHVMRGLDPSDYPVFLHTQPSSYRAVKLYTDFGFALLRDEKVGKRESCLPLALPYFRSVMPPEAFASLRFASAPQSFLQAAASSPISQF